MYAFVMVCGRARSAPSAPPMWNLALNHSYV